MQRPDTTVQCTLHGAYFDFCTGSIKTFIESTNYIPILHHYGKSCFWHSVSRHSIYQYIKQLNFQYNIHLNLHHIQLEKVFRNVKKYISTKFQNDLLVKISSHDLFNLPVKTSFVKVIFVYKGKQMQAKFVKYFSFLWLYAIKYNFKNIIWCYSMGLMYQFRYYIVHGRKRS